MAKFYWTRHIVPCPERVSFAVFFAYSLVELRLGNRISPFRSASSLQSARTTGRCGLETIST